MCYTRLTAFSLHLAAVESPCKPGMVHVWNAERSMLIKKETTQTGGNAWKKKYWLPSAVLTEWRSDTDQHAN